ncbi:hypothetical protein ACSBR1_036001 [Camellia fascicularis]
MEKMDCYSYSYSCKEKDGFLEYEVGGDVSFGESFRRATFKVYFNKDTGETNCNCRLFEFRGILCRHHIMIFMQRGIYRISHKYILRRWSKIVKRSHTKIRISYDKSFVKPEARRYDKMCNAFHEVADLATDSEGRCELVMIWIHELKKELKEVEIVLEAISMLVQVLIMFQFHVEIVS